MIDLTVIIVVIAWMAIVLRAILHAIILSVLLIVLQRLLLLLSLFHLIRVIFILNKLWLLLLLIQNAVRTDCECEDLRTAMLQESFLEGQND